MAAGLTEAEAAARAALLDVESYEVFLDPGADPHTVRSRTDIRFRCQQPGAMLTVEAEFPYSRDGQELSRFTDPADGAVYVLGSCFPTYASGSSAASTRAILQQVLAARAAATSG